MIEKLYGEGVFFEEAFNIIYPDAMEMAVEKSGIKPVGRADVTWATRQKRRPDHHRQGTG